ncbi:MAG: hypothetical protein L3K04_00220 [Thermoplasmata archaeon]|nr:hypothetical protein [Thermoplasmata archaeon]
MKSGLEVYLLPSVFGGGSGDLEEVYAAARRLGREGWPLLLYRAGGAPLPSGVRPERAELPLQRVAQLRPKAARALTVGSDLGVSAAPERPGRLGRAGPWAAEAAAIERTYGPDRVVHVSLGEFARTLTSSRQVTERYREGGRPVRWIRPHLRTRAGRLEEAQTHRWYARFRAFDHPRMLHLFPTFGDPRAFRSEFPAAVPTGPLWDEPFAVRGPIRQREWLWYASPSSSRELLGPMARFGGSLSQPLEVFARGPIDWAKLSLGRLHLRTLPYLNRRSWRARFAAAGIRMVTGSRTLIEAVQLGGPFLYFNGVLGSGAQRRRHRPEKLDALLRAWGHRVPASLRRDLGNFARARGVERILQRASEDRGWSAQFPAAPPGSLLPGPYDDAGLLLGQIAGRLAHGESASELVERVRIRQR